MRASFVSLVVLMCLTQNASAQEEAVPNEGGSYFERVRRELRSKFDADRDGRLSAEERETMRQARPGLPGRERQGSGRPRGRFQWPDDLVKKFDEDGDGELNREEGGKAWGSLRQRWDEIQEEFDEDGDGGLGHVEWVRLAEAVKAGKVKDLPFWVHGRLPKLDRGVVPWEKFDANGDGRFDEAELASARATFSKSIHERVETSPSRRATSETPADPEPNAADVGDARDPAKKRVKKLRFSKRGGIYEKPFELDLSTKTEGAEIRYTLDCSTPTATHGVVFRRPLKISRTTVVRAAAFKDGLAPRKGKTSTFVFLRDVVRQSNDGLPPAGAPLRWGRNTVDYGMDPDVVEDQRYKELHVDALESIPSISLVVDPVDLFGDRGIYAYARMKGRQAERPGAFEMFFPDHRPGIRVNCGVRIRGGFSRTSRNGKHGFRLFFRGEYGPKKLEYPLFGRDGADRFDNLDLRCSQNYSWNLGGDARGLFVRDQFSRDLQLALGQPAARGDYYHLYLNGQYWGLYNSCERPEASFGATYFGGKKDEYDVVKVKGRMGVFATDGNLDAWRRLYELASAGFETPEAYWRAQGRNPDGTTNLDYEVLLDVDNLIDYMLVIFWAGNFDAPITKFAGNRWINNWYGIRRRDARKGFRFFAWDSEHSLLDVREDRTGPFPAGDDFNASNPQWVFQRCLENAEFRLRVADRVELHFSTVLRSESIRERFASRTRQIELAVIGESARWGDAESSLTGPRNLEDDWRKEANRVLDEYIPRRSDQVLSQLWRHGIIPDVAVPSVVREDDRATIASSSELPAQGVIYFTINGSDPRGIGGAVSKNARKLEMTKDGAAVELSAKDTIRARSFVDGEWSSLVVSASEEL